MEKLINLYIKMTGINCQVVIELYLKNSYITIVIHSRKQETTCNIILLAFHILIN